MMKSNEFKRLNHVCISFTTHRKIYFITRLEYFIGLSASAIAAVAAAAAANIIGNLIPLYSRHTRVSLVCAAFIPSMCV